MRCFSFLLSPPLVSLSYGSGQIPGSRSGYAACSWPLSPNYLSAPLALLAEIKTCKAPKNECSMTTTGTHMPDVAEDFIEIHGNTALQTQAEQSKSGGQIKFKMPPRPIKNAAIITIIKTKRISGSGPTISDIIRSLSPFLFLVLVAIVTESIPPRTAPVRCIRFLGCHLDQLPTFSA